MTLLGWPLIHIRFAQDGRWVPVKAWIACGNIAYGILFAYGGVAVGAVSMGGVAVGAVTIGGCALGLLAFGGMGLGYFATGGLAVGYMACGGAAIAWQAACGGAAVAHDYALGGAVLAQHANDSIARAFMRNSVLLSHAYLVDESLNSLQLPFNGAGCHLLAEAIPPATSRPLNWVHIQTRR